MDRDYYLDDLDSEYDEEDIKTKGSKENHRAEKIASLVWIFIGIFSFHYKKHLFKAIIPIFYLQRLY